MILKLRKVDNSYAVTIPEELVEQLQLQEGQLLEIDIQLAETQPALTPGLLEAFEESWKQNEEAYRYLADR